MTDDSQPTATPRSPEWAVDYEPPALTRLGDLAELTLLKSVGASDSTTFLGVDLGSL